VCNPDGYYYSPDAHACILCPEKNGFSWKLLFGASFLIFIFFLIFVAVGLFMSCFSSNVNERENIKIKVLKLENKIIESIRQLNRGTGDDELLHHLLHPENQCRDGSFSMTQTSFDSVNQKNEFAKTVHRFGAIEIDEAKTSVFQKYETTKTTEINFKLSSSQSLMASVLSQIKSAQVSIKSIASFFQISVNVSERKRKRIHI